jgi:hypothetical protein
LIRSLTAETSTNSPALAYSITLSSSLSLGDSTAPYISSSPSLTSVTITLSSSGFLPSDVGKTIVFNGASIVISAWTSGTSVTGYVYEYYCFSKSNLRYISSLVVRAPMSLSSTTIASGSWTMYDFRSYIEYAKSYSQTATVTSSSTYATVTLSAGTMSLWTSNGTNSYNRLS